MADIDPAQRRQIVDREHPSLPMVRKCALLGVECQDHPALDGAGGKLGSGR